MRKKIIRVVNEDAGTMYFDDLRTFIEDAKERGLSDSSDWELILEKLRLGESFADATTEFSWVEVTGMTPLSQEDQPSPRDLIVEMAFRKVREDALDEFREEIQERLRVWKDETQKAQNDPKQTVEDRERETIRWHTLQGVQSAYAEASRLAAQVALDLRKKKPQIAG